jgi:hypothetical protein
MFFVPVVRRALGQVRYEFSEKSARAAVDSLRTQVQRLDATWQGSGFPTSMLAACSVHY